MDPTEIYDQPGKSRMGMDLEPVFSDEVDASASSDATVQISPVVAQNMGIRYALSERRNLERSVRTVGEVMIDEESLVEVNSRINGWVEVLHVAFDGAPVQKGDPLLEIYSPELVTTQEELLLALTHRDEIGDGANAEARSAADRMVVAARERLRNWDVPQSFINMVESHRMVHRRVTIEAPSDGVVIAKQVAEGARVSVGQELYRIADLSRLWIHASFYDFELPWISEGQQADIEMSYLPGVTLTGEVSYIYPFLRQKARDVHVRIIVENPDLQLKPGMFANVQLSGRTLRNVVVVPSAAILRSGERTLIFIDRGEGQFEPREVRIGAEADDWVQVTAGLEENERVVVSAQFLIDSESRLQEAIAKMRSPSSGDMVMMDGDDMSHDEMDMSSMERSSMEMESAEMESMEMTPSGNHDHDHDQGAAPEDSTTHDHASEEEATGHEGHDH
jgi:Cu(I)/Ag(I) efflux system membrane fusion protein/cobalt-zinc-cadmium efflux system membrane fusion protein